MSPLTHGLNYRSACDVRVSACNRDTTCADCVSDEQMLQHQQITSGRATGRCNWKYLTVQKRTRRHEQRYDARDLPAVEYITCKACRKKAFLEVFWPFSEQALRGLSKICPMPSLIVKMLLVDCVRLLHRCIGLLLTV